MTRRLLQTASAKTVIRMKVTVAILRRNGKSLRRGEGLVRRHVSLALLLSVSPSSVCPRQVGFRKLATALAGPAALHVMYFLYSSKNTFKYYVICNVALFFGTKEQNQGTAILHDSYLFSKLLHPSPRIFRGNHDEILLVRGRISKDTPCKLCGSYFLSFAIVRLQRLTVIFSRGGYSSDVSYVPPH